MKTKTQFARRALSTLWLAGVFLAGAQFSEAAPFGTEFTYQGRLTENGAAANGTNDFTFTLYNAASGGATVGTSNVVNDLAVSNGLFTATLDFGTAFDGDARWLQIALRPGASAGAYTNLVPRQPVTAAPYAIRAMTAGSAITASSVAAGAVTSSGLAPGSVGGTAIADGSITSADLSGSLLNNTFWTLGGNGGTTAGTHFLGTTDNQALVMKVANLVALQITPGVTVPNIVGGNAGIQSSVIAGGVSGAVIGGGNAPSGGVTGAGAGDFHAVYDNDGTVGGGFGNKVGSNNGNVTDAAFATVAGGVFNTAVAYATTVAGGDSNLADGQRAAVLGGYGNRAGGGASAVGGGVQNMIQSNANFAAIAGGQQNTTLGAFSFIGSGTNNTIQSGAYGSAIAGGVQNVIQYGSYSDAGAYSFIGAGKQNTIEHDAEASVIACGLNNTIQFGCQVSTISGGDENSINNGPAPMDYSAWATIGGGYRNMITGSHWAVIGGGQENSIRDQSQNSTIAGGFRNSTGTNAFYSTISGGVANSIQSNVWSAVIGGGSGNTSGAGCATVGGGSGNTSGGGCATVPGGSLNTAAGGYSFAAGHRAKANHDGAFVWADSQFADFASTGDDQFLIRAAGGVGINTNNPNGAALAVNGVVTATSATSEGFEVRGAAAGYSLHDRVSGAAKRWVMFAANGTLAFYSAETGTTRMSLDNGGNLVTAGAVNGGSDRNAKENFAPVDARAVLDKVSALPLSEWNYKTDTATRHVGPMAQDFYAAFNVGMDDKHIATVDADGVALAAIQGLNQKVEDKDAEIRNLRLRLEKLEQLLRRELAATEGK